MYISKKIANNYLIIPDKNIEFKNMIFGLNKMEKNL